MNTRRIQIFLRLKAQEIGGFWLDCWEPIVALIVWLVICALVCIAPDWVQWTYIGVVWSAIVAFVLYHLLKWLHANWVEAGRLAKLERDQ